MTAKQREQLEPLLKPNEVLVDTRSVQSGTDEQGFPMFETQYINNPLENYKLVKMIEPYNCAILEDLSVQA